MYRVMIADDEPIVAKAMMTLIDWKELDCEVICAASDGQEVLNQLESAIPDILVTDIRMPGADGIEIARYIKEHALKVKVIILTAYADFSYAQQALKYNVVDYITKTGAFEGLVNAVNKAKSQIVEVQDVVSRIVKGEIKKAGEAFLRFTAAQLCSDYSANSMKSSGISIQNECKRFLKEQGKTLYDITDLKPSITKTIYSCYYKKEYEQLVLEIIEKTAALLSESKNHKNRLITECERYINEHYCENLMVGEIADALDTSRSYLSRIFKETTGETMIATINQKKLVKAMEFLDETDMKIYEVADALGFENVTYFSHFFKKGTGISPKEYSMRKFPEC